MHYNWPQIVRVDPTSEDTLPGVTSLTEELKVKKRWFYVSEEIKEKCVLWGG